MRFLHVLAAVLLLGLATHTASADRDTKAAGQLVLGGNGTGVSASDPFYQGVIQSGSTGTDWSANPPSITGSLLKTIPANTRRANVFVYNNSGSTILVQRDKGDGTQVTIFPIDPGSAGHQGGAWESVTFKGQVKIYGPAGTEQVAAGED
jgi:hypothetical protein